MPYKPYADASYYLNTYRGIMPSDNEVAIAQRLCSASRHVDALTYNRIIGKGLDNLSEFRQEIIREVVCQMADFEYENQDMLDSALSGYSINGVSMNFSPGQGMAVCNGIVVKKSIYALLSQTGLTCRVLGAIR